MPKCVHRVAIVGAGPSGFYTTEMLLRSGNNICVDMFERLPQPFGLLRYGVAPDHQKTKQIAAAFQATMELPGYRLFANVEIGRDISLERLREAYDAVVLAYGANQAIPMRVPGENLPGSLSSTQFVGWYNGHPDHIDLPIDLSHEEIAVIGNGNVALDICRILASPPKRLENTDISDGALQVLQSSRIRRIHLVGRRGVGEASFTSPELRELATEIEDCRLVVEADALILEQLTDSLPDIAKRNLKILQTAAQLSPTNASKTVHLRFARSLKRIFGSRRVEGVELVVNRLLGKAGQRRAVATDEREHLKCGLVISSIGYRALRLDKCPFDNQLGTVPNDCGRVTNNQTEDTVASLYVVGWLKRGATGVIGTNRADALETATSVMQDLGQNFSQQDDPTTSLIPPEHRVITAEGWSRIDREEQSLGSVSGQVRQKLPLNSAIEIGTETTLRSFEAEPVTRRLAE